MGGVLNTGKYIFLCNARTDNRRKPVGVRIGEFMACAGMARPELLAGLVQSRHPAQFALLIAPYGDVVVPR